MPVDPMARYSAPLPPLFSLSTSQPATATKEDDGEAQERKAPELSYHFRLQRDGELLIYARIQEGGKLIRAFDVAEVHDTFGASPFLLMRNPAATLASFEKLCELVREIVTPAAAPACVICGCTEEDCRECIDRTGRPCRWLAPSLCSACVEGGAR